MEISPAALRKDTVATLREAEDLLDGTAWGNDSSTKATLLQTKAMCLNTLVLLRDQEAKLKK